MLLCSQQLNHSSPVTALPCPVFYTCVQFYAGRHLFLPHRNHGRHHCSIDGITFPRTASRFHARHHFSMDDITFPWMASLLHGRHNGSMDGITVLPTPLCRLTQPKHEQSSSVSDRWCYLRATFTATQPISSCKTRSCL